MGTKFYFDGNKIKLPGSYSRITSGRNNPPLDLDYGNILIIDSQKMADETSLGMIGGSGVAGENFQGANAIYSFNDISSFRDFVGAGWWYKAAEYLFSTNTKNNGVSTIYVIKPATTTSSLMTFTATGGGAAGGTFKIKTLDEGAAANGELTSTNLTAGYGYTIETGLRDTSKWVFKIWRATYKGLYSDGVAYNEVSAADSIPELIVSSPEFNNIQELIDWGTDDSTFNAYFKLDPTSVVVGAGTVDSADISGISGYQVSTGATVTYDKMAEALEAVTDLDYSFVITTNNGSPESDPDLLKIKAHILNGAKYDKQLIVAGDDNDLSTSITSAEAFNSEKVVLVHGSIFKSSKTTATGLREWNSFFHSCLHLGRLCGIEPQVPLTFKRIDVDGVKSLLSTKEQEDAIDSGVLVTIYDYTVNAFIALQGVNTLQKNDYFLNSDGTSHVIQFVRIKAQLNKELMVNARKELLDDEDGVNRSTISGQNIVDWTKGYLQGKIATDTSDNLILSYKNVSVSTVDDAYFVNYEFTPNSEIKAIFFTGFAL